MSNKYGLVGDSWGYGILWVLVIRGFPMIWLIKAIQKSQRAMIVAAVHGKLVRPRMACGVWYEVHLLSIIKPELETCFRTPRWHCDRHVMGDFPSVIHISFQAM